MLVHLLGGLEVLDDDGHEVVVAGPKLRAFLVVLALQTGRVVPTDQIVDALWGEDPPAAVRNGLQGLASKLRRERCAFPLPCRLLSSGRWNQPTSNSCAWRLKKRARPGAQTKCQ